ncbi:hypothetical protein CASFOL_028861 [Castilleja foliolosa]|uniref:Uncharacterized protein n=2 Tax=Castilleja foliolosa TaxID=1961234 RepID=A0ABD3CD57_9LAMI
MGGFPWFEGDGSDCGLMFRFQDELWLKVSGWSDEATGVVEEEDEQRYWLPDWEIMSTHWCEGTTSLCCSHLDEGNGSTVCLLMELPYSSKVGKQLQPVFEFDRELFSPQALSPVGTSLGSSRKVVLH